MKSLRCQNCVKPPSWQRVVLSFSYPTYEGRRPCEGALPIHTSYTNEKIGYLIPCLRKTTPYGLQKFFRRDSILFSIELVLFGDPPSKENQIEREDYLIIEWKDGFWKIIVWYVTSPFSLILNLKKAFQKIKKPLLIQDDKRKGELIWDWNLPEYFNNFSDILNTELVDIWGNGKGNKGDWSVVPVFLNSMELTSLYLKRFTGFINSFFGSIDYSRAKEKAREIKGMMEKYTTQDPLYVDPEWYM